MAVTYNSTVKDARMTVVKDAIDGGSGAGYIEICTAAYASTLLTFTLSDPCGTVGTGALTMASMPKSANAAAGGSAAIARTKDSSGTVVVSGLTVGTSGTDIIISNTTITNGAAYSLTSAVITHA
jgi:hypothetical protein